MMAIENKAEEAKAKAKEHLGKTLDDDEIEREGKLEKQAAKVKEAASDVVDKVKEKFDD